MGHSEVEHRNDITLIDALSRLRAGFDADGSREDVVKHVATQLLSFTDSRIAFICETQKENEAATTLSLAAIVCAEESDEHRLYAAEQRGKEIDFGSADSIVGEVLRNSAPLLAAAGDSRLEQLEFPKGHPEFDALLALPLLVGGSTIGVVALGVGGDGFDDSEVAAAQALADVAAQLVFSHDERSQRFSAVRALRETEDRHRDLVDNLTVGIFRFPLGGGPPLSANRVSAQLFGFDELEEFLSEFRWTKQFVEPGDHERLKGMLDREGQLKSFQAQMYRKDGSKVWIEWTVKLYWKLGFIEGALVDVSELKRAEQDRKSLESRLMHSQKLESLEVLAGGIAHDFNNLLMAISGNVELALLCGEFEDARSHVRAIRVATERASELAAKILAFTGKRNLAWEPLDVSDVVARSVHLFDSTLHRKIFLDLGLQPHLPPVLADEDQICQVLVNLVTNSAEAIGDQPGRITVSTSLVDCSQELLSSTYVDDGLAAGSYLRLQVMDNGSGISEETRQRMFEPFYTTKFVGRGLGLASTLGIVRAHSGAIAVEGEEGVGCVVTIYLPVAEGAMLDSTAKELEDMPWRGHGTVLLVDDEEMVRFVVGGLLRRLGFDVLGARNGREAVQVFNRNANLIDLVLLDLQMPEQDGVDTFFEIRKIRPEAKIILCSGYDEKTATEHLVGKGLSGFIQKPYTFANLKRILRRVITS